jgi:hemoglobin-like flavoprotein
MMTRLQIRLVQASFEQVKPISDVAARLFYGCLFEIDPGLEALFKGDLEEQGRKLMQMIGIAVKGLDSLEDLVPKLLALGARHAAYGVAERDYLTVRRALLWTLERGLGAAFTPEVKEAWSTVYKLLADTMKAGARNAVLVTVFATSVATHTSGDA